MTNQTDMYDQEEEDKMTEIMKTLWDEDCKKKMTDETGGWACAGEYGDAIDCLKYKYAFTCIMWTELEEAIEDGKFEGVDEEFLGYFVGEHSELEQTMLEYVKLSDWRVSKALIPFQAVVRGREVRWIQKVSKALIPFQALVRGRTVRWQYPLYALMSE